MEVNKGMGGCLWMYVAVVFVAGLITMPFGLLIWLIGAALLKPQKEHHA